MLGLALGESFLPVAPVKRPARTHLDRVVIIETARIDAEILRIGAWDVKRMNAAATAEGVLRCPGVELVGGQVLHPAQDFELLGRNANMQNAFLSANCAVSFANPRFLKIGPNAKAHAAAMASTFVGFEHRWTLEQYLTHSSQISLGSWATETACG